MQAIKLLYLRYFFFPQCKHVLAIKLAEAMDLSKSQQVTDLEMTNLIKNLE